MISKKYSFYMWSSWLIYRQIYNLLLAIMPIFSVSYIKLDFIKSRIYWIQKKHVNLVFFFFKVNQAGFEKIYQKVGVTNDVIKKYLAHELKYFLKNLNHNTYEIFTRLINLALNSNSSTLKQALKDFIVCHSLNHNWFLNEKILLKLFASVARIHFLISSSHRHFLIQTRPYLLSHSNMTQIQS